MAAPVDRVAPAFDESPLLEVVQKADELAAVVAERVGDPALRLARALVEEREHRVVLGRHPGLLERLEMTLLDHEAEPLEQEGRALQQLPRGAGVRGRAE